MFSPLAICVLPVSLSPILLRMGFFLRLIPCQSQLRPFPPIVKALLEARAVSAKVPPANFFVAKGESACVVGRRRDPQGSRRKRKAGRWGGGDKGSE